MSSQQTSWHKVGGVRPERLVDARVLLHWAAQVPGAVGNTLVQAEPDDGHTALTWDPSASRFVSGSTGQGFRVSLVPDRFTLQLLSPAGGLASELELVGRTLADAYTWFTDAVQEASDAESQQTQARAFLNTAVDASLALLG